MNEIITAAGIAVIATGAAVLLKQYKPEYAFGVSLAAGATILIFVMFKLGDIIGSVEEFVSLAGISNEHYKIMLRCLGVCMIFLPANAAMFLICKLQAKPKFTVLREWSLPQEKHLIQIITR